MENGNATYTCTVENAHGREEAAREKYVGASMSSTATLVVPSTKQQQQQSGGVARETLLDPFPEDSIMQQWRCLRYTVC